MYYNEIESFFDLVIGYNDSGWKTDFDVPSYPWLLHDMEIMLNKAVGYPSLLHLISTIAFLGYCINPKISSNPGDREDAKYFFDKYLKGDYEWDKHGKFLWENVRGKLAHRYFTKNAITTHKSQDHLKVKLYEKDKFYLSISVRNFWEDTKEAIKALYNDLKEEKNSKRFLERLDFLDQDLWKKNNEKLKLKFVEEKNIIDPTCSSGAPGPHLPVSGAPGPKLS